MVLVYLVPRAVCIVPQVKGIVRCGSIPSHRYRGAHSGRSHQLDRSQTNQCNVPPGHSLLSFVGRACRLILAAEHREYHSQG